MKTIKVENSKKYEILIERGLLTRSGALIRKACGGSKAVIVSDDNVYPLHGAMLEKTLAENGYEVSHFVIPHGEPSKNTELLVLLLRFLAQNDFSRSDVVCTLGGGVVGDFGALAAGLFNRGMPLAAIPTSLLAMVDSSVGGKTAVDLPEGKNLVGMFYQPDIVICDCDLLHTLPAAFFSDGMAEVIKYGMIASESLFEKLKLYNTASLSGEEGKAVLEDIIEECVSIKRDIVNADEFDRGQRQLLNFGHTIAHCIEQLSGYTIAHGSAVAAGMVSITRACAEKKMCGENCVEEIRKMVLQYDLPAELPFDADALAKAAVHDKKRSGGEITIVVPEKIGRCVLHKIPVARIIEFIGG